MHHIDNSSPLCCQLVGKAVGKRALYITLDAVLLLPVRYFSPEYQVLYYETSDLRHSRVVQYLLHLALMAAGFYPAPLLREACRLTIDSVRACCRAKKTCTEYFVQVK